ncbi:MAG TPA: hypothetical protein VGK64_31125 [Bryobacteraceae bacterium]
MKTICNWAALAAMLAPLCAAQQVHLTVPAVDTAGNAVPIGTAYISWGQFKGNDGIFVQSGSITRTFSNGTIDVTLAASDSAGYAYTVLLMKGSAPNTFKWRVPAAGASTMAQLNEPAPVDPGAGSGAPGGVQGSVQFNDGGSFGGNAAFGWSDALAQVQLLQNTTNASLKFTNGQTDGTYWLQQFSNNESGKADFGCTLAYLPPSNGATRRDNVMSCGFNRGPTGKQVSNDHAFFWDLENSFTTPALIPQMEFYYDYQNAANTVDYRPFSITVHLADDTIDVASRATNTIFGYSDTNNDWLNIGSTATSGLMTLSRNSTISYIGSNADWIKQNGHALIGLSGTNGRLFAGNTTANFFDLGGSISNTQFLLTVGNVASSSQNRGLRWNTSNGWQFQTGDSTWQNMGSVNGIWGQGTGSLGVGPASFAPGATLQVYDATATTGSTKLIFRDGAGQAGSKLELQNNSGVVQASIDASFRAGFPAYTLGAVYPGTIAALQSTFDPGHPLAMQNSAGVGWSSTSSWSGTIDTAINRSAAGVVEINSGTAGTLRDLKARNLQAAGGSTDPGCTTAADVGKFWTDATTNTTSLKFCAAVSGAIAWHAIALP